MKPVAGRVRRGAVYMGITCSGLMAAWLSMTWLGVVPSWPLSTQKPKQRYALRDTLQGHTHEVHALAYSPDGKTPDSEDSDSMLIKWDVAGGEYTAFIRNADSHPVTGRAITSIAFSTYGKTLASAGGRRRNMGVLRTGTGYD